MAGLLGKRRDGGVTEIRLGRRVRDVPKQGRPFQHFAAKAHFEPKPLDAAPCANVRSLGRGLKRGKVKLGLAKGLWHKIFQYLSARRCL